MAQESQLAHRYIRETNLAYVSNASPTSTEPRYVSGSQDLMTSIIGYAERRPGFASTVETAPTTFHNLQRIFSWDRFDGTFYIMACDLNASGFAQVYKLQVGNDNSFVSIFTDSSGLVFDFVVSNNTLYFGNGNVAKKWDPINGVSNWGIAIGSVSGSTSAYCGNATDGGGGLSGWANPTNAQGAPDTVYTTTAMSAASGVTTRSNALNATSYGFSIPATNTITGIQVTVTGFDSNNSNNQDGLTLQLLFNGSPIGVVNSVNLPASAGTASFGGSSYMWGTTLTASNINASTFGVQVIGLCGRETAPSLPTTVTHNVDAVQITIFALGGPTISVSGSVGTMTATAGYTYVFCYGNSNSGHVSSPSPVSASTGVFTNKASVSVTLTASTDPQVNQIRLFRTTDGGGGTYFELPTSPYSNSSGPVVDSAADNTLQLSSIAPTATFNDPPLAIQGMTYFSGRIWGFLNNKVYFSGLEEINQGVPEESFPSGTTGNFWGFDQAVQALAVAGNGDNQKLVVFCAGRIYAITGTTLDTFRRFKVSDRRGTRNKTSVTSLGGMVAWLDTGASIWATNGDSLEELSIDIRPDLVAQPVTGVSFTFHVSAKLHWLVCAFPGAMMVYDMDMEQWMPPWTVGQSPEPTTQYIYSGETQAGVYDLMLSNGTKALKLNVNAHNDNGTTYIPTGVTNLFSVVPDFGKRFSYIASGSYDEPSRTGFPNTFCVETNNLSLKDFLICADDDPQNNNTIFTSLVSSLQPPETTFNRTQGITLKQNVYTTTKPSARWIGLKILGQNADDALKIYGFWMAYKPLGGR